MPARRRQVDNTEPEPEETETVAPEHVSPKTLTSDRPQHMDEMVGQTALLAQLQIIAAGSRLRGTKLPHVLLDGPPGFGKTTLAGVIANEMHGKLYKTSGMALQKPEDLVGIMCRLEPNCVVFIDEVHALPRAVMESLYEALEDGQISTLLGSGRSTQTYVQKLPPFCCVAATTRPGALTVPFRDRFGYKATLEPYTLEELAMIVGRAWSRLGVNFEISECREVARRAKGIPRLALHLAERVLDVVAVEGMGDVPEGTAARALTMFGIDERGLDRLDWRILDVLVNKYAGRPVGIAALAQAVDAERSTLEDQHEGPLIRAGLIQRTPSGRMATIDAHRLLRKDQP